MKDKHHTEQNDIDRAHEEEVGQFDQFWDEKLAEFDQESKNMLEEMRQRQKEEMALYREELEEGLPTKAKDSQKLLELKGQREVLARQKSYIDAHLAHQQIEKMEVAEQEAFEAERKQKVNA